MKLAKAFGRDDENISYENNPEMTKFVSKHDVAQLISHEFCRKIHFDYLHNTNLEAASQFGGSFRVCPCLVPHKPVQLSGGGDKIHSRQLLIVKTSALTYYVTLPHTAHDKSHWKVTGS